ncbi:hypothetical protein T12_14775, partial [Trichinella patagoniensis]
LLLDFVFTLGIPGGTLLIALGVLLEPRLHPPKHRRCLKR